MSQKKRKKRPRSPPPPTRDSEYEMDGEQISDGDIEADVKIHDHSHEDMSGVSDLDSIDGENRQAAVNNSINTTTNGPSKETVDENSADDESIKEEKNGPSLNDDHEQLDFEADGQWKDVKEDGESESKDAKDLKDEKIEEPIKPEESLDQDKNDKVNFIVQRD